MLKDLRLEEREGLVMVVVVVVYFFNEGHYTADHTFLPRPLSWPFGFCIGFSVPFL